MWITKAHGENSLLSFLSLPLFTQGLDEAPIPLTAFYSASNYVEVPSYLQLDASSIDEVASDTSGRLAVPGLMISLNNLESFKTLDRQSILDTAASALWRQMTEDASTVKSPAPWLSFVLLIYCDLKTYKFYHWMCAPILQPPQPFTLAAPEDATAALAPEALDAVVQAAEAAAGRGDAGAFPALPAWFLAPSSADPISAWTVLADRTPGSLAALTGTSQAPILCFADPSNLPEQPGWPLRNLLMLAQQHPDLAGRALTVVGVRETRGRADPSRFVTRTVQLGAAGGGWKPLGWVANDAGRMGPRLADLGPTFSPLALADQAAALNLRLMRWREAPELQLEAIGRVQ